VTFRNDPDKHSTRLSSSSTTPHPCTYRENAFLSSFARRYRQIRAPLLRVLEAVFGGLTVYSKIIYPCTDSFVPVTLVRTRGDLPNYLFDRIHFVYTFYMYNVCVCGPYAVIFPARNTVGISSLFLNRKNVSRRATAFSIRRGKLGDRSEI